MTDFIAQLTELRRRFPQLSPRRWVVGRRPDGTYGVIWLTREAVEMTERDWNFPAGRFLSYVLGGDNSPLYIVLNAAPEPVAFKLPQMEKCRGWKCLLDTAAVEFVAGDGILQIGQIAEAPARSVLLFEGIA